MSIVAFNFTRIAGERTAARVGKYSIRNETNIVDVKEVPLGKQKALLFVFKNNIAYEPGVGKIELSGDIVILAPDADITKNVELFAKTKRVETRYTELVYNTVLARSTVQALIIARDVGLPAPVAMPRVKPAPAASAETATKSSAPVKNAPIPSKKK
jgi:hypothetical protein